MTMAMLTTTATVMRTVMIDCRLLLESNGMIAAIINFLFIFNENARVIFLATKVMVGGWGIMGYFCNVYGNSNGKQR